MRGRGPERGKILIVASLAAAIVMGIAGPALAAPANDNFANAQTLSGTSGSVGGTTVGATGETNEVCTWQCGDDKATVWYNFTPSVRGLVTITVSSLDFDPAFAIWRGNSVSTLTLVDWNADASGDTQDASLQLLLKQGLLYRIAVDRQQSTTGTFTLGWSTIPSPVNDDFANATTLGGTTGMTSGTTVAATGETSEVCTWQCGDDKATVWYNFTPPVRGLVTIAVSSTDFDPAFAIWRGNSVSTLTLVDWNADASGVTTDASLQLPMKEGLLYRVAVDRQQAATGPFTISWSTIASPANDDFANATSVSGVAGSVRGTTVAATGETNEPCTWQCGDDKNTVWYKWRAPFTGTAVWATTSTNFDAAIAAYQGNVVNDLTQITWDSDSGPSTNALMSFPVENGVIYRIAVDRQASQTGTFTLKWFPSYRPDGMIKLGNKAYRGNNIYNLTGLKQLAASAATVGKTYVFTIKVQNDGVKTDTFKLQGPGSGSGYTVKYLAGSSGTTNITSAVVGGTYKMNNVAVGASKVIRMVVKVTSSASTSRSFLIVSKSANETSRKDAVKAKLTR